MKVVFFGNGPLAERILSWLVQGDDEVVGLVIHPWTTARQRAEMEALVPGVPVFEPADLKNPVKVEQLASLGADVGVSIMYAYIIRRNVMDAFPNGCINLHPSLLPYNRGMNPNVWTLVEETPAGTTLHIVDEGIDTGPILAQVPVQVLPTDDAKSLYERLLEASYQLFVESWPKFRSGELKGAPQDPTAGTKHMKVDLSTLDVIDLDAPTTARKLLNRLRARTFTPYAGSYFVTEEGRRIQVRVQLEDVTDDQ